MALSRAGIVRFGVLAFFAALLMLSGPVQAWCGTLTFSGAFAFDNDVHIITFSTTHTGLTSVFTTSFASGGFLPVISLFDSGGNIIASDGGLFNSAAAFPYNGIAGASYSLAVTPLQMRSSYRICSKCFGAGCGQLDAPPRVSNEGPAPCSRVQ